MLECACARLQDVLCIPLWVFPMHRQSTAEACTHSTRVALDQVSSAQCLLHSSSVYAGGSLMIESCSQNMGFLWKCVIPALPTNCCLCLCSFLTSKPNPFIFFKRRTQCFGVRCDSAQVHASLIVVLTRGGSTARLVAKYRPLVPVLTVAVPVLTTGVLG